MFKDIMNSSQIVRLIRQEMGLSVKEFSDMLNVTPEYIYSIETKRSPSRLIVSKIIKIYLDRGGKKRIVNKLLQAMTEEYKKRNYFKAKRFFSGIRNI